jgi:peptidoglycan/LPS O-acetylase OafA/YrhL
LRIDSLWVGVFLAYHFNFSKATFERIFRQDGWAWGALFSLGLSMSYPTETKFMGTIGLTFVSMGFGATLATFVTDDAMELGLNRLFGRWFVDMFAKLGTYSYAIYLFHEIFIYYFKPFKNPGLRDIAYFNIFESRMNFLFVFFATIFVSVVATEYIEKPILKWRNRRLS